VTNKKAHMKNILYLILFCCFFRIIHIHRKRSLFTGERRLFADFLYCQKDYLRAADEYKEILRLSDSDTLHLKIGLSYLKSGSLDSASVYFGHVKINSLLYDYSRQAYYKCQFLLNHFDIVELGLTITILWTNYINFLLYWVIRTACK